MDASGLDDATDRDAVDFFRQKVDQYRTEHYDSGYSTFMSSRQEAYLREVDREFSDVTATAAVEAGCGPGILSNELAKRGFHVSAIDASPEMLSLSKSWIQSNDNESRVDLQLGDIERLPFSDESFDLYVSAGVIEYLATDSKALAEAFRVLRPGGTILISVTNSNSHAGLFDSFVERGKRSPILLSIANFALTRLGSTPVRPRHFAVRRHRPKDFIRSLSAAGFVVSRDRFFYFLPWPHPLDRFFPRITDWGSTRLSALAGTRLRVLGEGYLVVAKKPA